ncbi:Coenzyme A biosynthesis bifunctional protein CoaBC [compost metagenome]
MLQLVQNPDILQTVGTHASLRPSVVVGFAAETHDILSYARDKLERKGADFICANQVGPATGDRDSSKNKVILVTPSGHEELQETAKLEVGKMIGVKIVQLLAQGKCSS